MTETYRDALANRFQSAVPFANTCKMQITRIDVGAVEMMLPYRDEWLGDAERGLIHPGIVTALVDSACGSAVLSQFDSYEPVATIDLRMDYLRPALRPLDVTCRARCTRITQTIAFASATVWQIDADTPIATSQAVFMRSSRRLRERT